MYPGFSGHFWSWPPPPHLSASPPQSVSAGLPLTNRFPDRSCRPAASLGAGAAAPPGSTPSPAAPSVLGKTPTRHWPPASTTEAFIAKVDLCSQYQLTRCSGLRSRRICHGRSSPTPQPPPLRLRCGSGAHIPFRSRRSARRRRKPRRDSQPPPPPSLILPTPSSTQSPPPPPRPSPPSSIVLGRRASLG